jgi:hypothetical protein
MLNPAQWTNASGQLVKNLLQLIHSVEEPSSAPMLLLT